MNSEKVTRTPRSAFINPEILKKHASTFLSANASSRLTLTPLYPTLQMLFEQMLFSVKVQTTWRFTVLCYCVSINQITFVRRDTWCENTTVHFTAQAKQCTETFGECALPLQFSVEYDPRWAIVWLWKRAGRGTRGRILAHKGDLHV